MGEKKVKPKLLIFDLSGVLIDVSKSYRLAVKKTAEFFLGKIFEMNDIPPLEGFSLEDCYAASEDIIRKNGMDFRREAIAKKFNEYYMGRNFNGYILEEEKIIEPEMLKKLKKYKLAVVSDRHEKDTEFVLKRFNVFSHFSEIGSFGAVKEGNSKCECIHDVIRNVKGKKNEAVFVGGNASCLRIAEEANVPFIGVVPPNVDKLAYKERMASEGANIVLDKLVDLKKIF